MKIKIHFLVLFAAIFASSNSFAQYKYDIGIKMSTLELETFQVEARFHLKSPYTLLFNFSNGSSHDGFYHRTSVYNDSLVSIISNSNNSWNNAFKFGIQRKLSVFATDVFYAGATIGVGIERQRSSMSTVIYDTSNPDSTGTQNVFLGWEIVDSQESMRATRFMNVQLGASFGMDVPLSKRFSINAEVGLAGRLNQSLNYSETSFEVIGAISGGVRYSFGKRD